MPLFPKQPEKKILSPTKLVLFCLLAMGSILPIRGQQKPWSQRMAQTVMTKWPDSMALKPGKPISWNYEEGLVMKAFERVWYQTGNGDYFRFMEKSMNHYVTEEGTIQTYDREEYNMDHITPGRVLLTLYGVTKKDKYRKAAFLLREQLKTHPRTTEGGFWHKKKYPNQMWLDGLYMGEPFYTEFASLFNEPAIFDDVTKQLILMEKHARDPKTGLLYHGWDESKQQKWADPTTGLSPNVWGRAMGWYAMSLVEVLDYLPKDHAKRPEVIAILKRLSAAIVKYQDKQSGVWYQVIDKATEKGNYLESSASSMFVYALAKGAREGYLDKIYLTAAQKGYQGILKTFITTDSQGLVHLNGVCSVAGLGGEPYRDGSYAYYLSEKVVTDDPKGIGPFIMASVEIEIAAENNKARGKTVALDYYFNNETRNDAFGNPARFHYTWEDISDSGFSFWGNIFRNLGASTTHISQAPTAKNLQNVDVYIIVDPDTPKETGKPNFINAPDIEAITAWVKAGGVLVLMGNDSGNVEFTHFNQLAKNFGIEFDFTSLNRVQGNQYEMGKMTIPASHPVFKETKQIYIKEYASLMLQNPAQVLLTDKNVNVLASAKIGQGTVFAVGDPWLYNEYVDGRRLPLEYENPRAAKELATWLLTQSRKKLSSK
jgi:unsaturated rhamnogalacturonyl hydrolase